MTYKPLTNPPRRRFLSACVAAPALLMPFSLARAQWVVIDPANLMQTAITSIQSIKQYSQMVMDYAMQARQYMTMLSNLKSLDLSSLNTVVGREIMNQASGALGEGYNGATEFVGVTSNASEIKEIFNGAKTIFNTYKSTERLFTDLKNEFTNVKDFGANLASQMATTGLSSDQVLSRAKAMLDSGYNTNNNIYKSAVDTMSGLNAFQKRIDTQMQQAGKAEGAVQATQAVASLLHSANDQLSSLVTQAASANIQSAERNKLELKQKAEETDSLKKLSDEARLLDAEANKHFRK